MKTVHRWSIPAVCAALFSSIAGAQSSPAPAPSDYEPQVFQSGKDVVWVPTSQYVVDRMLDMAKLTPQDYLIDLGSGDGITVITAAKRGARAHGIEYNPDMVGLARRNAERAGVSPRATFAQADIFESDFTSATVISLFLLPALNLKLRPTLLSMKPGTRIVSNSFDMGDWKPDEVAQNVEGCIDYCTAYRWIVPAQVDGAWKMGDRELTLKQTFQMLEGSVRERRKSVPISEARLDGANILFTVGADRYAGEVSGNTMKGTVNGSRPFSATRAK